LSTIDTAKQARELAEILGLVARARAIEELKAVASILPRLATPGEGVAGDALAAGEFETSFDLIDKNVVAWARDQSSKLIVEINDELRTKIRSMVGDAVSGDYTNAQLARRIARIVPLHTRYANAVLRREDTLFRSYVSGGMDVAKARARAAQMADRYAAKLTRLRGRTIARTESMFASNNGKFIGQTVAVQGGLASPYLVKVWFTAEDEDVCPICGPLDNKAVYFSQIFPTGSLTPPAHPNCRCTYGLVDPGLDDTAKIDWVDPGNAFHPTPKAR
jgi:hypothetical protein